MNTAREPRRLIKCGSCLFDAETGACVDEVQTGGAITFVGSHPTHLPTVAAYQERRAERGMTGGIRPMVEYPADRAHRIVGNWIGLFALCASAATVLLLGACAWHHWKG